MIYLEDLAAFLAEALPAADAGDVHGLYASASEPARPVRRLGLALEPWPGLLAWTERQALDALFLHRPWGVEDAGLPPRMGVLAAHAAFDQHLGIGQGRPAAEALGLSRLQVCGRKGGAPLGWIGAWAEPPEPFSTLVWRVLHVFGGLDVVHPAGRRVRRVAVVGALREALVEEAHAAGAQVYVTGQWRPSAEAAVARSGMSVVAVGHARSERWGLRALAGLFARRFAHLHVVRAPG